MAALQDCPSLIDEEFLALLLCFVTSFFSSSHHQIGTMLFNTCITPLSFWRSCFVHCGLDKSNLDLTFKTTVNWMTENLCRHFVCVFLLSQVTFKLYRLQQRRMYKAMTNARIVLRRCCCVLFLFASLHCCLRVTTT